MTGRAALLVVSATLLARGHALPEGSSPDSSQTIGSQCSGPADCNNVANALCNTTQGTCQCPQALPIVSSDSCLAAARVGENCTVTAQCRAYTVDVECSGGKCGCLNKYYSHKYSDGITRCLPTSERSKEISETPVDPVMIGILVSLVLMFIIICIVLQLFSKARFRQNRTILNSANPRLMNSSFLKSGSAGGRRRGSHGSLETPPTDSEKAADGDGTRSADTTADPVTTSEKAG